MKQKRFPVAPAAAGRSAGLQAAAFSPGSAASCDFGVLTRDSAEELAFCKGFQAVYV